MVILHSFKVTISLVVDSPSVIGGRFVKSVVWYAIIESSIFYLVVTMENINRKL